MPTITDRIELLGAMISVKVMQTPQRVEARKKANLEFKAPVVVRGLVDTGASCCAIDRTVIAGLDLKRRGPISVHTPSTEGGYVQKDSYDVSLVLGEGQPNPLVKDLLVIATDLASQGFLALIGRDVLRFCILTYDGPAGTFALSF